MRAGDAFKKVGAAGRTVDGVVRGAATTSEELKKIAEALRGLSDEEKTKRKRKSSPLFAAAKKQGNYPNFQLLVDEGHKVWWKRKERPNGEHYPSENEIALRTVNRAGIPLDLAEELSPDKETLYIKRLMDLLDMWKADYLDAADDDGNLTEQARDEVDEKILKELDEAEHDPTSDALHAARMLLEEIYSVVSDSWADGWVDEQKLEEKTRKSRERAERAKKKFHSTPSPFSAAGIKKIFKRRKRRN